METVGIHQEMTFRILAVFLHWSITNRQSSGLGLESGAIVHAKQDITPLTNQIADIKVPPLNPPTPTPPHND